jgi:type II secretory pathway pseudopilin PulG
MLPRLSRPPQNSRSASNSAGLTLIECLVAIIAIGFTAAAFTPALVIAAATRVQSQRADQAIQVAQGEIDRIRALLDTGRYDNDDLPPITPGDLRATPPPDPDEANDESLLGAERIDVNNDGNPDFALQIFRTAGTQREVNIPGDNGDEPTEIAVIFDMGIRVYDIRALESGNLAADESAALSVTGGEGQRSRLPLTAIYTTMGRGDFNNSLCDYFISGGRENLPSACSNGEEDDDDDD